MMRLFDCEGWWEQDLYGRQPMENLRIGFEASRIDGSGMDVIGAFDLVGVIDQRGNVAIHKQYVQRHSVEYLGRYDGEGTLSGEWRIGNLRGRWMIKICRFAGNQGGEIAELVPRREDSKS